MKELVVISGKGGTGKTSITASFAVLAQNAVVADCDVDAADLHLVLSPDIQRRERFFSGHEASIRPQDCNGCGFCKQLCRFDAVRAVETPDGSPRYEIDAVGCEGCGLCARQCPQFAIDFEECECGEWFISQTRCGPMVHAALFAAAENSGKLVSLVREQSRRVAAEHHRDFVIIDGSPGIGCPVIASITGATAALIVAEPSVSGLHDMDRVAQVAAHFQVPTWVCVNKWDLHPEMTERIEVLAKERGMRLAGRVRYERSVTHAQMHAKTLVEYEQNGAAADVRTVWQTLQTDMNRAGQA